MRKITKITKYFKIKKISKYFFFQGHKYAFALKHHTFKIILDSLDTKFFQDTRIKCKKRK